MTPDPQLGGPLLYVIVLLYVAAGLWLVCWGVTGLARGYRYYRDRNTRADLPPDDGQPADLPTTLASIDAMQEQGRL